MVAQVGAIGDVVPQQAVGVFVAAALPGEWEPPSPAMRGVTMRTGALGRLELITRIPCHDSIAAASRALYGGCCGALEQMIAKIETAAGFRVIERSSTPLSPTAAGHQFIREALQILQAARRQTTAHPRAEERPLPYGSTTTELGHRPGWSSCALAVRPASAVRRRNPAMSSRVSLE